MFGTNVELFGAHGTLIKSVPFKCPIHAHGTWYTGHLQWTSRSQAVKLPDGPVYFEYFHISLGFRVHGLAPIWKLVYRVHQTCPRFGAHISKYSVNVPFKCLVHIFRTLQLPCTVKRRNFWHQCGMTCADPIQGSGNEAS